MVGQDGSRAFGARTGAGMSAVLVFAVPGKTLAELNGKLNHGSGLGRLCHLHRQCHGFERRELQLLRRTVDVKAHHVALGVEINVQAGT